MDSKFPDDDPVALESGFGAFAITRYRDGDTSDSTDFVAREVPVALVYNGISHAVMMSTPLNLVDFGLGFSFTEKIINQLSDVYDIEVSRHEQLGIEIRMTIATECFEKLKSKRRNLVGRTGCGVCGVESLTALDHELRGKDEVLQASLQNDDLSILPSIIFKVYEALKKDQAINLKTGAMHAAAWVDLAGNIVLCREDLGRHNALDKLIGALINKGITATDGVVIMTSRASYELVQKATRFGVQLLATISAPTSMAIELADEARMTLIGFVRDQSLVIYANPGRIST